MMPIRLPVTLRMPGLLAALLIFTFCAPSEPLTDSDEPGFHTPERPIPYPVTPTSDYLYAIERESRTMTGEPGDVYWTNRGAYDLEAELVPDENLVRGRATIEYFNDSPDNLDRLILELAQNLHKEGMMRKENTEITGGVELHEVSVRGREISEFPRDGQPPTEQGYLVDATRMLILLDEPVESGESIELVLEWSFEVPEQGAGSRMGRSQDNLFFIAYWYPQVMVYDDVIGWFIDPFLGNGEFYHTFADYSLEITLPDNWLVMGTGEFLNPEEVLAPHVYERYREAISSDEVVQIVGESDLGAATHRNSNGGKHTWKFESQQVRDVAFAAMRESMWDGARADIGDQTGDGQTDYTHIHSFYRQTAPLWEDQADYARHSISFLSDYLEHPYPWPHMTSVEGADIIRGGMEFPMITIMGSYNHAGPRELHGVTAHEFAHMWVPMIVSTNERRFTWMDEGFTTFNTHQAMADRYPEDFENFDLFRSYLGVAGTDLEGPIMRRSDFHYPGPAFGVASYPKPASVLQALKTLIGEETFREAYLTFLEEWTYKHPYPWDFFNTVERVAEQDLEWFWRSWYYETWILDQAVESVDDEGDRVHITIADHGEVPMPVYLTVTLEDGTILEEEIPVDHWLEGRRTVEITIETGQPVTGVSIDPDENLPDVDRSNNNWGR